MSTDEGETGRMLRRCLAFCQVIYCLGLTDGLLAGLPDMTFLAKFNQL